VGILGEAAAPVPLSLLMRRELNLVGSHGMAAGILPHLLGLVASGHLAPEKLITRRVGLTEGIEYLRVMPERPGDVVLIDRMTP
jgi:alcohol dehydrogenase